MDVVERLLAENEEDALQKQQKISLPDSLNSATSRGYNS
jgi:hypothetical protein